MNYFEMFGRYDANPGVRGRNYEKYVMDLVGRQAEVEYEPAIDGRTPDLLVRDRNGDECIVECTTLSSSPDCDHNLHSSNSDPARLHGRLYSSLENKMRIYTKELTRHRAYVVAIQNECCSFFARSVRDVLMGAWRLRQGQPVNLWEGENYGDGLFGMYPHCSGVLHSTWSDHLYFPNPRCAISVNLDLFSFARIADPIPRGNGAVKFLRQAIDLPGDTIMTNIGPAYSVDGKRLIMDHSLDIESVVEVIGEDEDGTPMVSIHMTIGDV